MISFLALSGGLTDEQGTVYTLLRSPAPHQRLESTVSFVDLAASLCRYFSVKDNL